MSMNIVCPVESEIVYSRRPSNENYIHENLGQIFPIQCCHLVMNEQKFSRHAKSQFFVFRKILTLKEAEKVTQDHVYPERLRVYKVKTVETRVCFHQIPIASGMFCNVFKSYSPECLHFGLRHLLFQVAAEELND